MIAPPPWRLTGDGFVWLFRFSRAFAERCGFLADWQRARLVGALGAMMLVDYRQTDVGPYRELLFIPGRFDLGHRRAFSISKIYVSTEASVRAGIENWGIPKALASFARERHADGSESFSVACNGQRFFSTMLVPFGLRFPISSALVPLTVAQALGDDLLITRPIAKGTARLCRVRSMWADGTHFPNLAQIRPLAVFAVRDFQMTFPVPEVRRGYFASRHD